MNKRRRPAYLLSTNDSSRLSLDNHVFCPSKVQPSRCKRARLIEIFHDGGNLSWLELEKRRKRDDAALSSHLDAEKLKYLIRLHYQGRLKKPASAAAYRGEI